MECSDEKVRFEGPGTDTERRHLGVVFVSWRLNCAWLHNSSEDKRECKTYSSRDSHVVTHRSTNLPFNCLCMAERTGCPVFS
ncbi:hypothetical protein KCU78_g7133, partial [Aureobasidium melanogenum]